MDAKPTPMIPTGRSRIERDVDAIVEHVKHTKLMGERQARRFVGRRLTANTLLYWRVFGMFPVGFRNGSKPKDARLYRDGGRYGA